MAENDSYLPDTPPEQHVTLRNEVANTFKSVASVIGAATRPLPRQTGDGSYITKQKQTGVFQDLIHMHFSDYKTLIQQTHATLTGDPVDDKTYLMERDIKLASELPFTSKDGGRLSNAFIQQLYNDLQHPPVSYLGNEHRYRTADGSFNNPMAPKIGAANTHYARTVRPQSLQPADRPDPGDLFDNLMARDVFKPHPAKLSSMFFNLASIIIHDLFRTDHRDYTKTKTSSYLDLAPLYGNDQTEQDEMRTFHDGKIKADCFSNKRVLGFPPGVGAMLIMFNRFHNYVVEQLATINESGRFTKPKNNAHKADRTKYDNDLFQTGRLITCGLYVNCILKDYVRTILNLNRTSSDWDLDPRTGTLTGPTANGTPGNQVSAEFNLVYRWHAAVSERDDKWTREEYKRLFPGKEPSQVSMQDFLKGLGKWEQELSTDPQKRPFAKLKRSKNGSLSDDALVAILTNSVEDVAGSFGARGVPTILRAVEILGIEQARSWNLATLNEFRAFFKLQKHETFESINSDPAVAASLKHFYDHPDFVELYPGLAVEETKPFIVPGSGLCTNDTISRAVLSDAVALVRGDRFYTVDYTPNNLTNWGFKEVESDITVDHGHVIYKLFLRAFPNHFQPNSVYAHFPFVIPEENRTILKNLEIESVYNWDRPAYVPPPTFITTYDACKSISENKQDFKVTWGEAIKFLMHNTGKEFGADFMLSGDMPVNTHSRNIMDKALYRDQWEEEVKSFYEHITLQLLHDNSYKISGTNQVDIVRDVANLAQAHFAAEVFCLPLKTKKNHLGVYTESMLYGLMALVFTCIFYDADPAKSFPLRQAARTLTQQLGDIMETFVMPEIATAGPGWIDAVRSLFHEHSQLGTYGVHMIHKLLATGLESKDILWSQILPTAGGMVANQGQLFSQCLDYYLSDEGAPHLKEINRLAKLDTLEADNTILRYFMEGSRMTATVGLYREVATETMIHDGEKLVNMNPGDKILLDMVAASQDPKAFPHPNEVRLDRPMDSYIHYGHGPHVCLGLGVSKLAMTTMLKTVGKLDNLRRAPGPQGEIKKVPFPGGITMYMTADHSSYFPFPTTMKVRWDGDLPPLKK